MTFSSRTFRRFVAALGVCGLVVSLAACGSDSDSSSRTRNAALLAGTACTKLGSTKKTGGVTNVCASASPSPLWYEVSKSKGKAVKCKKPGTVKMVDGVAWVCSGSSKKASWVSTLPLPVVVLQGPTDAISTAVESEVQPSTEQLAEVIKVADSTTTTVVSTTVASPVTTGSVPTMTSTTTAAPVTTVAPKVTCANGGTCSVGDTGPGGGTVFFVSKSGFRVSATGKTAYYLETTSNGRGSTLAWCAKTGAIAGADGTGIGDGAQNTIDMAKACASGVGNTVASFESGGKTDWYLPSKAELNEVCKWINGQTTGDVAKICTSGTFRDFFYGISFWSSTENDAGTAWKQPFGSGVQWAYDKTWANSFYFTPIRAF